MNEQKERKQLTLYILIVAVILITLFSYFFLTSTKEKNNNTVVPRIEKLTPPVNTVKRIPANNIKDSIVLTHNKLSDLDLKSKFPMLIRLVILGSDSIGGQIKITKNRKPYLIIDSKGMKYSVAFDFNAKYLIECSKDGFTTKVVYFDSSIPAGRENREFAKFTATVELHKSVKGEKINTKKPVGEIKYNREWEDFNKVE
jgi:hypothetical protein